MPSLTLLFAALLTLPDPAGDARGDGGYRLPSRPALSESALDLRSFSAEPRPGQGGGMRLSVSFGQIANPWGAPSGFSAGVTDIFVKTSVGGNVVLADTGLRARSGGWQYHLRVTGFGSTLEAAGEGGEVRPLPAPTVRVEGTSLVIDAAIPPGNHAYWVTSSVYSPLTRGGVLRPTPATGPTALQAGRAGAPTPVDVLASPDDTRAYADGTLAAQGQTRDRSTLTLVALGIAGLLLTLSATLRVWRLQSRG